MHKNFDAVAEILKHSWRYVLVLVILAVGFGLTWRAVKFNDLQIRAELLGQAELLGGSIDVERIRAITGSKDDR